MDFTNMLELHKEKVRAKSCRMERWVLFIDSFSSHILNEEVLNAAESIRTSLQYFRTNNTEVN